MTQQFDAPVGDESDMQGGPVAPIDEGMKTLALDPAEYPDLAGLPPGSPVKVMAEGTVGESADGSIVLQLAKCDVETEGMADKEYKKMQGEESSGAAADDAGPVTGGEF